VATLLILRSPFLNEVEITCLYEDDEDEFNEADVEYTAQYVWFIQLVNALGIIFKIKPIKEEDMPDEEDWD